HRYAQHHRHLRTDAVSCGRGTVAGTARGGRGGRGDPARASARPGRQRRGCRTSSGTGMTVTAQLDHTTRRDSYVGALDGLRAIAVVAVIIFHFAPAALPAGFLGVDVFFVVSGFLITRLVTREIARSGTVGLG